MKIGTRVRIVEDEYPGLVGLVGTVTEVSRDGTAAWVNLRADGPIHGVWCSVISLEDTT